MNKGINGIRAVSALVLPVVLLLCMSVSGDLSFAQSDSGSAPPVKLDGPDILKMDWKTRALRTADLNGDGRSDMAVLNNNHARVDLLYHQSPEEDEKQKKSKQKYQRTLNRWEPTLTDAPFVKEPLVTGIRMYDLALGDLNGDKRTDIAYTGSPDDLTVRFQDDEGTFKDESVFDLTTKVSSNGGTLKITDLNGDNRPELVVLGKEQIFVYVRTEDNSLQQKRKYGLVQSNCYGLRVLDLNQDDHVDLLYRAPAERHALRMRPGLATGGFGPERKFDIQAPKNTVEPLSLPDVNDPVLAYLQSQTEMITLLRFFRRNAEQDESKPFSLKSLSPRVYSTDKDFSDGRYTIGDLDGNQRPDIVAADPGTSEFLVYLQSDQGVLSEPERFPGPNDVRSIAAADINQDGSDELFMVSRGEELLGISRWKESGRLNYPRPLPVDGKPLAVDSFRRGTDNPAVAVAHVKKGTRKVSLLRPSENGERTWKTTTSVELDMNLNPSSLRSVDANRDRQEDLAIFAPGSPVRFLVQKEETLQKVSKIEGDSGGMLSETDPSALHTGNLDGDETNELFLAENNYLRSIEISSNGSVNVLDQYNARSSDARVTAGMVTDVDRNGTNDLLLLDERSGSLQLLQQNQSGVYRFVESARFGNINQVRTDVLDFDGDGTDDLLVFGEKQFWKIPVRPSEFRYEIHETWKMDMEDVTPSRIAVGHLNEDATEDLIAADTTNSRVLGVYTRNKSREWLPSLVFKVFSSDPHYQGKTGSGSEPREIRVSDATGDGKDDLILLVHDRILIYPRK